MNYRQNAGFHACTLLGLPLSTDRLHLGKLRHCRVRQRYWALLTGCQLCCPAPLKTRLVCWLAWGGPLIETVILYLLLLIIKTSSQNNQQVWYVAVINSMFKGIFRHKFFWFSLDSLFHYDFTHRKFVQLSPLETGSQLSCKCPEV